jgi:F-type H+-transporting ATPase subunit epsilon
MTMRLRVLLPTEVLLDREVARLVAEAGNGSFCLLPRHVDFVAALVPGSLRYTTPQGDESFIGIDTGTLVKRGSDVFVSVVAAVHDASLERLAAAVQESFRERDEDEREARGALARLEAGALRRFYEQERQRRG